MTPPPPLPLLLGSFQSSGLEGVSDLKGFRGEFKPCRRAWPAPGVPLLRGGSGCPGVSTLKGEPSRAKSGDLGIGTTRTCVNGLTGLGEAPCVARMRAFCMAMRSQETRPAGVPDGRLERVVSEGSGGIGGIGGGGEYLVAGRKV